MLLQTTFSSKNFPTNITNKSLGGDQGFSMNFLVVFLQASLYIKLCITLATAKLSADMHFLVKFVTNVNDLPHSSQTLGAITAKGLQDNEVLAKI